MTYECLSGLKPEDYEHPGEKAAMAALRKIPLLDIVVGKYIDMSVKFDAFAEAAGSFYRITDKTSPRIYRLYRTALSRLGMDGEYPLFSKMDYNYNAYATGVKEPMIVIHSSCINEYSDGELLNIIGHEIGHIKSGHMLYYGMAGMLNSIFGSLGGIAQNASIALQYALMDWKRNAEYTADRAGLIAAGDIDAVNTETMKMLGHSGRIPDVDYSVDKVLKQADDFALDTAGIIGKLLYVNFTLAATHPWAILRLEQINEWYRSGEFEQVVRKYADS